MRTSVSVVEYSYSHSSSSGLVVDGPATAFSVDISAGCEQASAARSASVVIAGRHLRLPSTGDEICESITLLATTLRLSCKTASDAPKSAWGR
jgi:hypothetical protein